MTTGWHRNPYLNLSHYSPHCLPRCHPQNQGSVCGARHLLRTGEWVMFSVTMVRGRAGSKREQLPFKWALTLCQALSQVLSRHCLIQSSWGHRRWVPKWPPVPRCGYWGLQEPGISRPPNLMTPLFLAWRSNRIHSRPHAPSPHIVWPALFKSTFGLFLPSKWLGNSESPESFSSCSKLNYIHQPGASTIVPRAFPALIRIFLFSLGEGGQPISAAVTLPGARTWNCGAHGPSDGAANRRWSGGPWFRVCMGSPLPSPILMSWCGAKNGEEGAQEKMSLKRYTHVHVCTNAHTHSHTKEWGTRESACPHMDWSSSAATPEGHVWRNKCKTSLQMLGARLGSG